MAAAPVPHGGSALSISRLPVRGARNKRPATEQEAATVPEQKRARPGPAASTTVRPSAGGGRAPLKALSVTAASRPAAPRKAVSVAAAPRAGAPPGPAAPRSKRPPWDLKGQVTDLRAALGGYRDKAQGLAGENRDLREQLDTLQRDLRDREARENDLTHRLGILDAELVACREEAGRSRRENEGLAAEKCRLEEEAERRGREMEELVIRLEEKEAALERAEAALAQQAAQAAQLRAQAAAQEQRLGQQEEKLHRLEMERRRLHNLIQELKGNIRVFCRVRPLLPEEEERQKNLEHLRFPPQDNKALVLCRPEESHIGRDRRGDVRYDFSFDRVFPPAASQHEIFEEIASLVQSALDGYHVCIFAYGQTGSGKTYTMEGPEAFDPETRGMIPRAVRQVFQGAQELAEKGWEYDFSASFLEIYNESLRDLLAARSERGTELEIRRVSSVSEELHVPNLRCVPVTCEEEVLGLLRTAAANRSVARTALNDRSSRSHSVFQLRIRGSNAGRDLHCASILSLVDLAGSERLDKSQSRGGDRLRETQAINTSLSALGLVIMALSNKESHIPYRNSKLTYLLQNSLGGSAKMLMFVNISPLEENFAESLNSLRFASKVNECVIGTAHANRK
ncbi:kinesin-like protein KIFC1 isoform X1 [Grus americana]|uniref:kinesin-like protein KIFC1 isoform X1 n=1 Tax=Grus americana TaxID=9117 RepID=UPI002407DFD6|nr:kinesin-like protein KIFC1 isoform X1 [Grus americana]